MPTKFPTNLHTFHNLIVLEFSQDNCALEQLSLFPAIPQTTLQNEKYFFIVVSQSLTLSGPDGDTLGV